MARITPNAEVMGERTRYYLVRRAQAAIAGYRHFGSGDLAKYLERAPFQDLAESLTNRFFPRSKDLAIGADILQLYLIHLIMAPLLQALPLSYRYDWHRGHLMGWFRGNCSSRIARYHFGYRTVPRTYQPELLAANLEQLGCHDADMGAVLLDLYRRHSGGTVLKDLLAHQLFDPILMMTQKEGYELRFGSQLFRLEKAPFTGSIDLRRTPAIVSDFSIKSAQHTGGNHLEILISEACLNEFRTRVKAFLNTPAPPDYKVKLLRNCVRDLVEQTRPARSAKTQIQELAIWLKRKTAKLAGTSLEAGALHHLLINSWLQRADHRLHLKAPNFFRDPGQHELNTYLTFFSPYREL